MNWTSCKQLRDAHWPFLSWKIADSAVNFVMTPEGSSTGLVSFSWTETVTFTSNLLSFLSHWYNSLAPADLWRRSQKMFTLEINLQLEAGNGVYSLLVWVVSNQVICLKQVLAKQAFKSNATLKYFIIWSPWYLSPLSEKNKQENPAYCFTVAFFNC